MTTESIDEESEIGDFGTSFPTASNEGRKKSMIRVAADICYCFTRTPFHMILFLISISIYTFTTSSVWNVEYNEVTRRQNFDEMVDRVTDYIDFTKDACTEGSGFSTVIGELFFEGKYHEVVRSLSPYVDDMRDNFGGKPICLGYYAYVVDGGDYENYVTFGYEECAGMVFLTNFTNRIIINPVSPTDPSYDFYNHTYDEVSVGPLNIYDSWVIPTYSVSHEWYLMWFDSWGGGPSLSYTWGSGPVDRLGPDYDLGKRTSFNIWMGISVGDFSQHFLSITPNNSYTFLVEMVNGELIAVSENIDDYNVLFDEEKGSLISPLDYDGNRKVGKVYEKLLEEENLKMIKDDLQTSFRIGNDDIMVYYSDSDDGHTEFLLVNVKSVWKIQESVFISIIVIGSVVLTCFYYLCCCWLFFVFRVCLDVGSLSRGMKKANQMKLDKVKIGICGTCSFFEVYFIRRKFQNLVERLKEYRSFLPETLVESEEKSKNILLEENDDDYDSKSSTHSASSSYNDSVSSYQEPAVALVDTIGKFNLGAREIGVVGVMIIFGVQNMKKLDLIYEVVLQRKRSYMMYEFGFGDIRIYIKSDSKVLLAANIIHSVNDSLVRKGILNVRYLLCKSKGYFGNLGSKTLKKSVVGGPIKDKLKRMKEAAPFKNLKLGRIDSPSHSGKLASPTEPAARLAVVDLQIFVDERCSTVLRNKYELRLMVNGWMYEMGNTLDIKGDEWMYELQKKSDLSRWKVFNEAVELYNREKFVESGELFQKYKEVNADDTPTDQWIQMVEEKRGLQESTCSDSQVEEDGFEKTEDDPESVAKEEEEEEEE